MNKVFGVKVYDVTIMIEFEYLGSLGWGVRIGGIRYLRYVYCETGWEPSFHKMPHWITMAELLELRDILLEYIERPMGRA